MQLSQHAACPCIYYVDGIFDYLKLDDVSAQALPYDIHSIMHYKSFSCSSNGEATMTLYPHGCFLPMWKKQDMPTVYDYLHINLLYCHGKLTFLKKNTN